MGIPVQDTSQDNPVTTRGAPLQSETTAPDCLIESQDTTPPCDNPSSEDRPIGVTPPQPTHQLDTPATERVEEEQRKDSDMVPRSSKTRKKRHSRKSSRKSCRGRKEKTGTQVNQPDVATPAAPALSHNSAVDLRIQPGSLLTQPDRGVASVDLASTANPEGQSPMVTEPVNANHYENAVVPEIQDEVTTVSKQSDAVVPMVRVYLTESVHVAPHHSEVIPVQMEEGWSKTDPLLLQEDEELLSLRLSTDEALLQPDANGQSHAVLTNFSGATQCLNQGDVLGQVVQVEIIEAPPTKESVSRALRVTTSAESQLESERKKKLREMLTEPDLPDNEKCAVLDFLVTHHDVFSLEEGERGETDLIEMEIDTGDAAPK